MDLDADLAAVKKRLDKLELTLAAGSAAPDHDALLGQIREAVTNIVTAPFKSLEERIELLEGFRHRIEAIVAGGGGEGGGGG